MRRAPRLTKRERKGPFVKPKAPAVPRELIYVELGGDPPACDANRGRDAFNEV